MKIKKKTFLFFLIILFLTQAGLAFALEADYPTIFGLSIDENSSLPEYAKYFFNAGIMLAGILAVIVVAFGGVYYLVSLSRGSFTDEGKQWIKAGVLGLLLIMSAYLIAYTINPALVIFDLKGLAPLTFLANLFETPSPPLPVEVYNEIPIGILAENVVARQIDCYDFDFKGDPIPGDQVKTDDGRNIFGPTYLEHDRTDCSIKLAEAFEKKSNLANELAKKISELMATCSCAGNCETTWNPECNAEPPCVGQATCGPQTKDCCSDEAKEKIEHGPIKINLASPSPPYSERFSWYTAYAHMDKIYVSPGQNVNLGTPLGEVGEVATDTGPHLHFVVGFPKIGASSFYKIAISFDIYSKISAAERIGTRFPGTFPMPLPPSATPEKINFIKNTLAPPLNLAYCVWQEEMGSRLHTADGYWAQDWICKNDRIKTESATVYNMSGGAGIKSTVSAFLPEGVVIKHEATLPPKDDDTEDDEEVNIEIEYRGLDEFRSNNSYSTIKNIVEMQPQPKFGGKEITVMNVDAWHDLKLIDQLTYFEGKIGEIKQKVQFDLNNLEKGEGDLGRCYLADSYVDFLKLYENNNKDQKIITVQTAFRDLGSGGSTSPINPAKYCKGFEYENSTCYSQCQQQCPGTTKAEFDCYKGASNKLEIKNCYDNRVCLPGLSPFQNFSECMAGCKISCFDQCEQKSGKDKAECQLACNDDSQCLRENESACVVNFNWLKDCTDPSGCISLCGGDADCENSCRIKHNNPEFLKNCAETSAALCTYGSDQNSGFPDCLKYPYSISGNYSSSFIYENPMSQICSNPNAITSTGATCQSEYPETAKCPSASKCPECPCGITYDYLESGSSSSDSGISRAELDHTVVNSNCGQVSFNDDPLTFYCNQTWWENKDIKENQKPLGESFTCAKEKEIPVGNTVDDAEKWARNFIEAINKFNQETYDMIRYLVGVGREQDYCECGSKCGPTEFACQPKCEEGTMDVLDSDGNKIGEQPSGKCEATPCIGNSCQKMIHILLGGSTGACQGEGVATYLNKVRQGLENFKGSITGSERSDILKELEYSRKMVHTCSQDYSKETRLLSCTRIEDEIIPPIIGDTKPGKAIIGTNKPEGSYCYGQALGEVLGAGSVADNWFCCQSK